MNRLVIICLMLTSCGGVDSNNHGNKQPNSHLFEIDEYKIVKGSPLESKDWICDYPIAPALSICFKSSWEIVDQDVYSFFAYLDLDSNEFFVVANYNMDKIEVNQELFVKTSWETLRADSLEPLKEFDITRLFFKNSQAIHSKYIVSGGDTEYCILSMTFDYRNVLYDFTLRVTNENPEAFAETFRNILHNIKIEDDKYYFDKQGDLKKVEMLSPDQL